MRKFNIRAEVVTEFWICCEEAESVGQSLPIGNKTRLNHPRQGADMILISSMKMRGLYADIKSSEDVVNIGSNAKGS